MKPFERNVSDADDRVWRSILARAEQLGSEVGATHAEWLAQDSWGGRVASAERARAEAAAFLKELERGGAMLGGPSFLSGEWADDPREADVLRNILWLTDFDESELSIEDADQVLRAWLDAADAAFWGTLERSAREVVTE